VAPDAERDSGKHTIRFLDLESKERLNAQSRLYDFFLKLETKADGLRKRRPAAGASSQLRVFAANLTLISFANGPE